MIPPAGDNRDLPDALHSSGAIENPYVSPVDAESSEQLEHLEHLGALTLKQTTFFDALFRWSLICAVSAGPSFFLGLAVTNTEPWAVAAMVLGIIVFAVGYAILDTRAVWRRWMSQRASRRAIISVFGLRMIVSIIFPIGLMNDIMVGAASLSATQWVSGYEMNRFGSQNVMGPLVTLMTTLLDGLLLNCELIAIGLLLFAIFTVWDNRRQKVPTTISVS